MDRCVRQHYAHQLSGPTLSELKGLWMASPKTFCRSSLFPFGGEVYCMQFSSAVAEVDGAHAPSICSAVQHLLGITFYFLSFHALRTEEPLRCQHEFRVCPEQACDGKGGRRGGGGGDGPNHHKDWLWSLFFHHRCQVNWTGELIQLSRFTALYKSEMPFSTHSYSYILRQ